MLEAHVKSLAVETEELSLASSTYEVVSTHTEEDVSANEHQQRRSPRNICQETFQTM